MFNSFQPPTVKSYARNVNGRDFVVGDIHGQFDLLVQLLQKITFDSKQDRIFSVGDLVDRGPYSKHVTDWLSKPWFHAVRGNHEQMVIDCIDGSGDIPRHIRNGGAWFYDLPSSTQLSISEALRKLPLIIEVELAKGSNIAIVHAEPPLLKHTHTWLDAKKAAALEMSAKENELALYCALYSRTRIASQDHTPIEGIEKVYVGHSTVPRTTYFGNVVYVDTGCSFIDGALSLIDINTGTIIMESMHQ